MCRFKFLILMVLPITAFAGEDPSAFLNDVVDSFNGQDCLVYSSHFVESARPKKRKEAGLFFASNDSKMVLKEHHVLSENENEGSMEVAVSYSIDGDDYVSRLFLEKEGDEWKIDREVFVKRPSSGGDSSPNYSAPQAVRTASQAQPQHTSNPFANRSLPPQSQTQTQNCPGGVCGGPKVPFGSLKACRDYGFEPIPCRNGSCSIK